MKNILRVGLATVIAVLLIGGSAVVSFAQCPCIVNCPAGDGGVTAPPPPGGHKTPDLNGDARVDLVDLAIFAGAWPPGPYLFCADYDCNGLINLVDLATFSSHWLHVGTVPGYNAPGIDHYKVYETLGPTFAAPIRVKDQFGEYFPTSMRLAKFATPVSKNDEAICDTIPHQSWWEIFVPGQPWAIEAQDQFGTNEWMLGDPRYLVLPALKNEGVGLPLPELNHYICYEAQGPTLAIPVRLVDQFDQVQVIVLYGAYFCNPCQKEDPTGLLYPIVDPWAHMTVYFVDNTAPYGWQVLIQDQFLPDAVIVLEQNQFLAVPALKTQVFPAGSSEWQRIKALYD